MKRPLAVVGATIMVFSLAADRASFGQPKQPQWFEPPQGAEIDPTCTNLLQTYRYLRKAQIDGGQREGATSLDSEMRMIWNAHLKHVAEDQDRQQRAKAYEAQRAAAVIAQQQRERAESELRANVDAFVANARIAVPVLSAKICQAQDAQKDAKRRIKEAKGLARRGAGVVDLLELKEYQDQMGRAEERERSLRAELKARKKPAMACSSTMVDQLRWCVDEDRERPEFCTDPAIEPFVQTATIAWPADQ
jgi:hypothetical protein